MDYQVEKITFTGWANGGAALGRAADGRVVFANGILPGETAMVRIPRKDARFYAGEIVEILQKSEDRIAPRCPIFGYCNLCQLQFLDYESQLAAKREILLDHLSRIGKISDPDSLTAPIQPAKQEWHYRHQIELYPDNEGKICLPDKKGGAVRLNDGCPLCCDAVNELLRELEVESDSGLNVMEVRAGDDDELQIIFRGEDEKPQNEIENDSEVSLVYAGPEGSYVMSGVSTIRQSAAGVTMAISDSSNFPANPEIRELLAARIQKLLPANGDLSILDLRCGSGFWCKWFASRCRAVTGLCEDEQETEDFIYNLDEFENVSLYIAPFRESLDATPITGTEWAVCEAGTAGFGAEEITALCHRAPQRILYLSDDPATLSRDCTRFTAAGYALMMLFPFDPAPQTAAISCLAVFENKYHG